MIDTWSKFQLIVLVDTWRTDALSTLTFELDKFKGNSKYYGNIAIGLPQTLITSVSLI